MQEPCISVLNLLYAQWGLGGVVSPASDPNTAQTVDPRFVHFTNRYWAFPDRVHNFQISVMAGDEPNKLIGVGSTLKYRFNVVVPVHLWILAGTSVTLEAAYASMRNMTKEVSRIIKTNSSGATDLQIIKLFTGYKNYDDIAEGRAILHRALMSTGIYYET